MHIFLRQEYMSLHNTFFAYSSAEEQKYSIDESNFSLGHKFTITKNQTKIATISQQSFGLKPNYDIKIGDQNHVLHRISNQNDFLYSLSDPNWQVVGDIEGQDYAIIDENNSQIGSVMIKYNTIIGEALDVYTVDPANEPLVLAIVITVETDYKDYLEKLEKTINPE